MIKCSYNLVGLESLFWWQELNILAILKVLLFNYIAFLHLKSSGLKV